MARRKPATALGRLSIDEAIRGLSRTGELTPDSAAVVIGIGGSGIQTIARLRAAIRGHRPEEAAIDSVQFLGIDAVDTSDQQPPLPPGVNLGTGEFFNLVGTPFDAYSYIQSQLPSDAYLQTWWDPRYQPPMGPLTEGLKRERMLGRLAFHRVTDQLVRRIQASITAAVEIGGDLGVGGDAPDVPRIPIYVVNSAVGGTGSSGFLPVVFAAWTAARGRGYYPEIRAFTYLPSVFRGEVNKTVGGNVLGGAHDANAYAYFREVDHFLTHGSTLGAVLGRPPEVGGAAIPEDALLKQVYLIGSTMRGIGELTRIEDVYEITAESLYHFLMTDVGMPLVGVAATNTDRALGQLDKFDKPRRYCSLGIARVVFPGDTYRRHLTRRYIDWFITNGLLNRSDDLRGIARNHELTFRLVDAATGIDTRALSIEVDDEVHEFLDIAELGMAEMERVADVATAQSMINRIERSSPSIARSVRQSAREQNGLLLAELDHRIAESVFGSGSGVPFAVEVLEVLAKRLARIAVDAEANAQNVVSGRIGAEARVRELLTQLQAASNRALYARVAAKIGSVAGKRRTQEDIATLLGQAIQTWAQAIHATEVADARATLARDMTERVETLRSELDRATERLRLIAQDARDEWTDDTLIGKDAGPEATTTLIPSDAQPEIEDSRLAAESFAAIEQEHGDRLEGELLNRFIARWGGRAANRSFFSLGSDASAEQGAAEQTLVDALLEDARTLALFIGEEPNRRPRLPQDLETAQPSSETLRAALEGLVRLSRSICWSWEEGRFQLGEAGDAHHVGSEKPAVTTHVAHPRELRDAVAGIADPNTMLVEAADPERVVALSVEWAVPVHALHDIPVWKTSYERLLRQREHDPRKYPPAHIDQRFEAMLQPLVPQYFEAGDVAKEIGQALVFKELLEDPATGLIRRYDHTRSHPPVPPLRLEPDGHFRARVLVIRDERMRPLGSDIDLGTEWGSVLERIGKNQELRNSIRHAAAWALRHVGVETVLAVLASFLDEKLELLIDAKEEQPQEKEILSMIFDQLSAWQVELRSLSILG